MTREQSRLDWVRWWAGQCVLQADPDWDEPRFFTPPSPRLRQFIHANPLALGRYFDLPAQPPPAPEPSLMRLGALNADRRALVLRLMAVVCRPAEAPRDIAAEQVIWCRRLAKALRPGLWLPADCSFTDDADALALLRVHYGEACWPRLRLLYPRALSERSPLFKQSLPAGRLKALCEALIWKAETPESSQGEGNANEENVFHA
ncbi:type III secretion protein [Brenneria izadpanahii]|uniref:Type III secretion protein n=1 Tax=Brenneria izadpanahii TaxID=2722756 RepID=A0ABX7UUC5_9GAMM|nr:type III secretion protein [Brenneria izadpanahii]QTF08187.1 type III secretion protein [Brenneria izadpanahii]